MNQEAKPLSFSEFEKTLAQHRQIPSFVFKAVNTLLYKHWDGYSAQITQDEILNEINIPEKYSDMSKQAFRRLVFDKHWLDIEPHYEKLGWTVQYDKPGFNEDYKAFFLFTKATK